MKSSNDATKTNGVEKGKPGSLFSARPGRRKSFIRRARGKGGKALEFTEERRRKVLRAYGLGWSVEEIAAEYHVSTKTLYRWRNGGAEAVAKREAGGKLVRWEEEFADFYEQWEGIGSGALDELLVKVRDHDDWRASAFLLQARKPSQYSEKYRIERMKLESQKGLLEDERALKRSQKVALDERTRIMVESFARGGTTFVLGAEAFVHGLLQPDQLSDGARAEVEAFCARLGIRFAHARELGFEPEDIAADEARVLLDADVSGVTTPVPRG